MNICFPRKIKKNWLELRLVSFIFPPRCLSRINVLFIIMPFAICGED